MTQSSKSANTPKPANKRGAARLSAVQALYQMEINNAGLLETIAEYETLRIGKEVDGETYREVDIAWFRTTVSGVIELQKSIDPVIHEALPESWPLRRLQVLLRAILRAGVFELVRAKDVPSAVVISEYVDIAKAFFDTEESRMVNAILDAVARKVNADDPTLNKLKETNLSETASLQDVPTSDGVDK